MLAMENDVKYVYALDKNHALAIRSCWCYTPEGAKENLRDAVDKHGLNEGVYKLFRIEITATEEENGSDI